MLSDLPVGSSGDSGVGGGKPAAPVVVPSPSADVDQVVGKESNNLLLFVCYLYVFNTEPTHSLHTTTDKLSRHAYTLPSAVLLTSLALLVSAVFMNSYCCLQCQAA